MASVKEDDVAADRRGRTAQSPGEIPLRGWKDVLIRTVKEFDRDNMLNAGAAAAFFAWLALVPAAIASIALYGLVASPEQVGDQINQLTNNFSDEARKVLADPIRAAIAEDRSGLTVGLILSLGVVLWTASGGINALIEAINKAYDENDSRSFLTRRALALALTVAGIVAFVIAVSLIALVPIALRAVEMERSTTVVVQGVRWVLLAVMMLIGLAILYRYGADRARARVRWLSWGAVVATVLWLVVSAGFSFYVNNFGSYNRTYGALAGVIVLNLWLYLSCLAILFGAELNAELEAQTYQDSTVGPDRPLGERGAVKADEVGESTD